MAFAGRFKIPQKMHVKICTSVLNFEIDSLESSEESYL